MRHRLLAWVCAVALAPSASWAAIEFSYPYCPEPDAVCVHTEEGFSYQISVTYLDGEELLYLHDDGGITSSTFTRQDRNLFGAIDVDLNAYSKIYVSKPGADPGGGETFNYNGQTFHLERVPLSIRFSGYRRGRLVASDYLTTDAMRGGKYSFAPEFKALDALELAILPPEHTYIISDEDTRHFPVGTTFCQEWCGALRADNLRLSVRPPAPVPLPAGGLPLAAGLLFLSALAAKTRRSSRDPSGFFN